MSEYRERDSQIQILDQNADGRGMAPRSGEADFGAGLDKMPHEFRGIENIIEDLN